MTITIEELINVLGPQEPDGHFHFERIDHFVYPVDVLLEDDTICFTANRWLDIARGVTAYNTQQRQQNMPEE